MHKIEISQKFLNKRNIQIYSFILSLTMEPHHWCDGRVLTFRVVDLSSGCVKPDNKIGLCCFSAKHAVLRSKSKDWMAWNRNNVSEWNNIFTCRLLFHYKTTTKCVGLVQSGHHYHIIDK
jgi:hypothetical protein